MAPRAILQIDLELRFSGNILLRAFATTQTNFGFYFAGVMALQSVICADWVGVFIYHGVGPALLIFDT